MKEILRKYLDFLLPISLAVISIALIIANYTPGTWLSGWDTLHPEFNWSEAFRRAIYGVWRPEQGLGALAVHSHMSELPRLVLLWISSLVLPDSVLRYFFFGITLILGPLGVYYFNRYLLGKKSLSSKLAAFVGGLYYLLNLGTLQHLYVPFEMFAVQFVALPWLFLAGTKALKKGGRKNFIYLFIVSFLAAPMAYAATLFYAFFGAIVLYLLGITFVIKNRSYLKRSIALILLVITTNSFWILPNLYSIKNQSEVVEKATINQLFSDEAFQINKEYGNLGNVLLHKNFLFSWREYDDSSGEFTLLLDEWIKHLDSSNVLIISYTFSAMALLGAVIAFYKKDKKFLPLLSILLVSIFFLINENPPFGFIYSYLRDNIGLFREALRMPFTKFSVLFMFSMAIFMSYLLEKIFNKLSKVKHVGMVVVISVVTTLSVSLIYFMKPAFQGNLISQSMKTEIPGEYFQAFDWFSQNEPGRVMKLPIYTYAGWVYYDWGYEGAGFTTFGTANPQMDRDFDRWSPYNENFYNEVSYALYQKDYELFEKILDKYDVSYLILDNSVIDAGTDGSLLYKDAIKEFLNNSDRIQRQIGFGFIEIYKFDNDNVEIYAPEKFTDADYNAIYLEFDPIFNRYGTYSNFSSNSYRYPFISIDNRNDIDFNYSKEEVIIRNNSVLEGEIGLTDFKDGITPAVIGVDNQNVLKIFSDELLVNDKIINRSENVFYSGVLKENTGLILIDDQVIFVDTETKQKILLYSDNPDISFYGKNPINRNDIVSDLLEKNARLCADPNTRTSYLRDNDSFEINAKEDSVCLGSNFEVQENSLLELSFATEITDLPAYLCITKEGTQGCINRDVNFYRISGDAELNQFKFYQPLERGRYWLDFVAQGGNKNTKRIIYRDAVAQIYPFQENTKFSVRASEMSNVVSVSEDTLSIKLPKVNSLTENFLLNRGRTVAFNCDQFNRGVVEKKISLVSIRYEAYEGAVNCDHYVYPDLSYESGYLLHISGENYNGRSLKIYFKNLTSGKVDMQALLPEGVYDETFVILPKNLDGKGYSLHFETKSFERLPSVNEINKIEIIPIPYSLISNIRLHNSSSRFEVENNADKITTYVNNLFVNDFYKTGTYKYKADIDGNGLVALSQSYDEGWIAYTGSIFGNKFEHIKVNGWANGWIIPEETNTITLVYWPQYLQFAGYAILLITFVFLTFPLVAKKIKTG